MCVSHHIEFFVLSKDAQILQKDIILRYCINFFMLPRMKWGTKVSLAVTHTTMSRFFPFHVATFFVIGQKISFHDLTILIISVVPYVENKLIDQYYLLKQVLPDFKFYIWRHKGRLFSKFTGTTWHVFIYSLVILKFTAFKMLLI